MGGNIWNKYESKKRELKDLPCDKYEEQIKLIAEVVESENSFICSNCKQIYSNEFKGNSELARIDNICEFCMEEGYGR